MSLRPLKRFFIYLLMFLIEGSSWLLDDVDGNMDHKALRKKQSIILTQSVERLFFTPQRPFIVISPRNMRFNCVRMTSFFCKIYNMKYLSDFYVRKFPYNVVHWAEARSKKAEIKHVANVWWANARLAEILNEFQSDLWGRIVGCARWEISQIFYLFLLLREQQ